MESECSKIFFKIDNNGDPLFEILIRVDPDDIFNCILVSKDWLSVITSPLFRSNYGNKWNMSKTTLMDSLRIQSCEIPTTTNLGRKIHARNVMPQKSDVDIGSCICQSPKGNLLLFGRMEPADQYRPKLYVYNSAISVGEPVQLPESPPLNYSGSCCANIIPYVDDDDDNKYSVVLVGDYLVRSVLVYSSWTRTWERFKCISTRINLKRGDQEVSITVEGGHVVVSGANNHVIYWEAWYGLAAFNVNTGTIAWICEPPYKNEKKDPRKYEFRIKYCSFQGSLHAIVCSYHRSYNDWHSKQFAIQVWTLYDESDWRFLYKVRKCEIWNENSTLLTSLIRPDCQHDGGEFVFVSFVPGKSDSIFVALEERVFIYHFRTRKLEYVENLKYDGTNRPLTLVDLGDNWPSSPPSLQLSL